MMTHVTPIPTLDSLRKYTFRLHAYKSVSLTRMQRYTQLAYLFHQCGASLFKYVSQFIVETYCFADGRCLSQATTECYIPLESV